MSMSNIFRCLLAAVLLLSPVYGRSQTILYPGDISIITVNADGEKNFEVLLLTDISAGTVIHFTDKAWINSEQSFRSSEGTLTYTATANISAGTVIDCPGKDGGNGFVESGSFNPAGSGDNIIVYQGSADDPFFLFGIGWARGSTVWEYSTVSAGYRSDVPMGLSADDCTIVSLGTKDNYRLLSGALHSGSRSSLLTELSDPANYESSNTGGFASATSSFTVQEDITSSSGSGEWRSLTWTKGLPGAYVDAVVSGDVWIETDEVVHSLTIEAGASVEIHPAGSLTITKDITNLSGANGLVIKADASGSGSLYHACDGVEGSVEVYLSADQWHFVSSPVSGAGTVQDVFGDIGTHLQGIYVYNEGSAAWESAVGQQISIGTGYDVYYQNDPKTLVFRGLLNSFRSRYSISVSRGAGEGWNLIGNPFPCAIAWGKDNSDSKDYINYYGWKGQSASLEHKTIYVTTGGSGGSTTWDTFNGTSGIGVPLNRVRNIAPAQAFWVQAAPSATTLQLGHYTKTTHPSTYKSHHHRQWPASTPASSPHSQYVQHDSSPHSQDVQHDSGSHSQYTPQASTSHSQYTPQASPPPVLRLRLSDSDGIPDHLAIALNSKATDGFDAYDSEKYSFGSGDNPQIASLVENKSCVINTAHYNPGSQSVIPITLYSNKEQNLSLSIQFQGSVNDFPLIILKDKALGIECDLLNQNAYEFHAGGGLFGSRFELLITSRPPRATECVVADLGEDNGGGTTAVENIRQEKENDRVDIYNMLGQYLLTTDRASIRAQQQGLLKPGVYITRSINHGEISSKKIIIR